MSASPPRPEETRRAPAREAILAAHSFPGEYTIKAFGPAGEAFRTAAVDTAHAVVGPARVVVSERGTRSGDRVCLTFTLQAERVEEVEEVYVRLYSLPEVLLIF
jgi:putative lipoic acid-binding regulatory protein